jgi:methyltransferase (TIGR00027 family)
MKAGRASKTAELVCMGRAIGDGAPPVARYSDPTAYALLPEAARERVQRYRRGEARGLRQGMERGYLRSQSQLMVARTVEIDDAIRGAAHGQVVLLGAGLDGRAYRMRELRDATVFEVDHPDSQRDKRARAAALSQAAREVRFVSVDFTRDALGAALAAAGHDAGAPTTWVWEGVVMYLSLAQIRASLAVIAERSAPRSRLIVAYHRPAPILSVVGPIVRLLGEPLRSSFTPEQMRALLAEYGFSVTRDEDVATIAAQLSPELGQALRMMKHLRIVTADR